jgi:hypothetical protein
MRNHGTIVGLSLLLSVGACDALKGGDKEAGSGAPTSETTAPKANPIAEAFMMGRKYGFSCVYALLGETASSEKAHGEAKLFGTALGVTTPPAPTKEGAMDAMRTSTVGDEIKTKHGDKAAAAYALGVALTDAFFGASIEADIATQLADIEKHARAAGVPESVWKAKLDALKTKADADALEALAKDFTVHLKG